MFFKGPPPEVSSKLIRDSLIPISREGAHAIESGLDINVHNVNTINVMDVNVRNQLFAIGQIDRQDLWPKITEYEEQALTFRFQFGLDELPIEPGILLIRGPRQYGKSTWLEISLRDTLEDFGKGSAYFINGDDLADAPELEEAILNLIPLFNPKSKVKRLFVDEITSIPHWEKALKRLADRREIKDLLVVTTGSKATDLRRGSERLPGRKGKLKRTEFIFTGISYKDFHSQCAQSFKERTWIAYLISGGSPIAAKELWQHEHIPEYFFELTRDWIMGELAKSGRSRTYLITLMRALFKKAGSRLGYLNLAKDSGMANNTIAAEYIEQLSDLLSVIPFSQWDADKEVPLQRKPCKFHFVNLSVAGAFSAKRPRSVEEFERLLPEEKGSWLEWLVAQELFRRQCILGYPHPEQLYFWASKTNEIDFVDAQGSFYEVKLGKTGPLDFAWFPKVFPSKKLLVISESEFETKQVKGITIDQFLLADGFLHPYPGSVDDPDVYNDLAKFNEDSKAPAE